MVKKNTEKKDKDKEIDEALTEALFCRFYPGHSLHDLHRMDYIDYINMAEQIGPIIKLETGDTKGDDKNDTDESKPQSEGESLTGPLGAAIAKQILPKGKMPDFVYKPVRK